MTPKTKTALGWILTIGGSLGGLAVVGMAAQFWISVEVKDQLHGHVEDMSGSMDVAADLTTDVASIKATVVAIDSKTDTAIENQQRFEEIFMEYLRNEASR
jgi:hypothetical protein